MRMVLAAFVLFSTAPLGCSFLDSKSCTADFRYGLNIQVKASNGTALCDAQVTATEGDYTEMLEAFPGSSCAYVGAGERAGTYRLEVQHAGYRSAAIEGIAVEEDEAGCHVVGVSREITLEEDL